MNKKLIIIVLFSLFIFSGCTSNKNITLEEFNTLNKCQSDIECTVGQAISDPSPSPGCYTIKVIEASNPKHLFASKNSAVLEHLSCSCNLTSNTCETKYLNKEK